MSDHSVWTWQLEIGIKSSSQNNYVKGADRYISLALKANQTKTYIRRQSHTFFPFRHGSKGSSRTSQTLQLLLVICLLCVNLIARTGVCVCVCVCHTATSSASAALTAVMSHQWWWWWWWWWSTCNHQCSRSEGTVQCIDAGWWLILLLLLLFQIWLLSNAICLIVCDVKVKKYARKAKKKMKGFE